ncbi:hypothetical protein SB4_11745 [Sphingomonas sanguinis]|uniref:DUF2274 domain-containing protein n=1 Tax=Sphingomonas sanguinis TaxID=33051 RepID=A0A147ISB5_9SPHN|nr:hypothetical protein SB4_11745 [Sphingomonas sanguinis]
MSKLKLGPIVDDKPVKVTMELPAGLHPDLTAYAEILAREAGQPAADPIRLIVPMLERFRAIRGGALRTGSTWPVERYRLRPRKPLCQPPAWRLFYLSSGYRSEVALATIGSQSSSIVLDCFRFVLDQWTARRSERIEKPQSLP